ncbi:MAG: TonB-dependent receptor [Methylococcaceae bacterium]|nr:TonB-dependent receptor [Methylococcaceae bacterium]
MMFVDKGVAAEPDPMDEYFSMSPEELASIPVSIASGTPGPVYQSAAVTSVITAEQIKAMGATELHEILETVPGVHANLQEVTNDYHYTIRGINNATNSQTLMLLNGTRVMTPIHGTFALGIELPVDAIERVEVIRGPGSALYGADAFAGVINIVTKKAKEMKGATVGVRAGNWNTQSTWGQYGHQWAGWDIAASLQYQHSDGDRSRIIQADSQTILDSNFGTQASHAPGPMETRYKAFNGHLNLQRKHWDIGFWALSAPDIGTRAGAAAALDPSGAAQGEQYLGDIRYSTEDWFVDWEFKAHTSYLQADTRAQVKTFPDNTVLPIGIDGNIDFMSPQGLVLFQNGTLEDIGHIQRIPSIELSSLYKGLAKHLLKASAGYRYEEVTVSHRSNNGKGVVDGAALPAEINGTLTDVTGTPFAFLADMHRSIWSAALQDEWQMTQDWQLTTGVRYDEYSDFGGTVNPRAALIWNINKQLTNKIMYGRAFRAPSFTEQGTQNNPVLLGNPHLKPETINTVEWAIDYRPFSSFRTAANVFYYHINDLIVAVQDVGTTTSTNRNFGNQDGYGTELEWDWQLNPQWNLKGNYAWQHSCNSITHQRVTGVPEHQVYFAAAWQFFPRWQLQSQLNWIGSRTSPIGDNRQLNDYETVDLTLTGKKLFGHVNIAASLRNLFDANAQEPAVMQLPQNLPLPGRSFYVEASVNF